LIKLVLHAGIGKVSLSWAIVDNAHEIIQTLIKLNQLLLKGVYQKYLPYKHYESCYCIRPKAV
jgi:hypothetical protein